jgi:hypothetical protein
LKVNPATLSKNETKAIQLKELNDFLKANINESTSSVSNKDNNDLKKLKEELDNLVLAMEANYQALNFTGARNMSIVIGSQEEQDFSNIIVEIDAIRTKLGSYYQKCNVAKPSDLTSRINEIKIWDKGFKTKKEKVTKFHNLLKSAATNLGTPLSTTYLAYQSVVNRTDTERSSHENQLQQLETIKLNRSLTVIEQGNYDEHKAAVESLSTYQEGLVDLVSNKKISVKVDNTIDINKPIMDGGTLTVKVKTNNDAIIAHEMQHLIQVERGQLALLNDEKGAVAFLYDLNDEVEAYRVEFLVDSTSVPGTNFNRTGKTISGGPIFITKLTDITTSAITKMASQENIQYYKGLPSDSYTIYDTLDKLNKHPRTKNALKEEMFYFYKKQKIKKIKKVINQLWDLNKTKKMSEIAITIVYDPTTKQPKLVEGTKKIETKPAKFTNLFFYKTRFNFDAKA